jgi:hypothetical protein
MMPSVHYLLFRMESVGVGLALVSFSFVLQTLFVVPNCLPRGGMKIPYPNNE